MTGIVSDTYAISRLLHEHGALSFWDFAAAAPYVAIEMDPPRPTRSPTRTRSSSRPTSSSAGPGTPGVLVARRELFRNRVPDRARRRHGRRTSTRSSTSTSTDIEHREEGGTPAIVESIRAGLVFQLKEAVGVEAIREREDVFIERAIERWARQPGDRDPRQPRRRRGCRSCRSSSATTARYLHHNFVVALLNDLFGIQSRGGCSCAGPYGHRLLGHRPRDVATSSSARSRAAARASSPAGSGSTSTTSSARRCSSSSSTRSSSSRRDGWRLLPHYAFEPATGLWRHRAGRPEPPLSPARHPLRRRADGLAVAPPPRAGVAPRRATSPRPASSWPARRARSAAPSIDAGRGRPGLRGRCAGSCSPRTSAAAASLTARVSERGPGVPAVLGLDLGTTEAKAALVGLDGTLLGLGRAAYPHVSTAPTGARSRIHATGGARSRPRPGRSTRWAGAERRGRWRSAASARDRRSPSVDGDARARRGRRSPGRTGAIGGGGFGLLPKIAWLARRRPDAAAEARWLLASWDALGLWLTGEAAPDAPGPRDRDGCPGPRGGRRAAGAQAGDPLPFGTPLGRAAGGRGRRRSASGRGSPSSPA